MLLKQENIIFCAHFAHFFRPYGYLYFSDVSLLEEVHAKPALTYAPAYCKREPVIYYILMELKLFSVFFSVDLKLAYHGFRIYADAHGAYLESVFKYPVP